MSYFNIKSYELYKLYIQYEQFNEYNEWKIKYDDVFKKKEELTKDIEDLNNYNFYINEIEPRKNRLKELEEKYKIWEYTETNYKIQKAEEYLKLKEDINKYILYEDYIKKKDIKIQIETKKAILLQIEAADRELTELKHTMGKVNTKMIYKHNNNNELKEFQYAYENVKQIIELLEIVIGTFKNYRKDLYENHILKGIVSKANEYISTLCHNDTKKFEIDFMISDIKDIIHINWLIRNCNDDGQKQLISINQASGFQQFAIAIALRMSMYSNKICDQLFIDEGFTACDKLNLSIVPSFLKGLLKTFKSIIIVSHIDIINDSVDNSVKITYDQNEKKSMIRYGNKKKLYAQKRKTDKKE